MKSLLKFFVVGIGGFFGAGTRYFLGGWIAQRFGTVFPWGTIVINVTGSFLLGLIITLLNERYLGYTSLRLLIPIGFIGAYTTFSTFELEVFNLSTQGGFLLSLAYLLASVIAGFVAVWLGVRLGYQI